MWIIIIFFSIFLLVLYSCYAENKIYGCNTKAGFHKWGEWSTWRATHTCLNASDGSKIGDIQTRTRHCKICNKIETQMNE